MLITVAICTWNRAALLDKTLAGLKALEVPAGLEWELLVVDNASTDDTPAVMARYAAALPLRPLKEAKQGHSHARNCAVADARGSLIVWTDDDVLVSPDWLAEYARAAEAWPRAAFFGGAVAPWFEVPPPGWLTRNWARLSGFYAVRELGDEVRPFSPGEQPFGANMAFRLEKLREFPFDPGLGHVGEMAKGGDETDVVRRLRAAGHEGVWVGTAKVRHYIPAARLTKRFIWDYTRRLTQPEVPAGGPKWAGGAAVWLFRQYTVSCLKSRLASIRGGPAWVDHFLRSAGLRGQIDRCRNVARAEV